MRHTTVVFASLWLACCLTNASRAQTPPGEGPTEVVQHAAQGMLDGVRDKTWVARDDLEEQEAAVAAEMGVSPSGPLRGEVILYG